MFGFDTFSEAPYSTLPTTGETYSASVAETAAGTDAAAAVAAFLAAIGESSTATDAASSVGTLLSQVAEAVTGADTTSAQGIFNPNIAETATATDTPAAVGTFNPNLAETATATDTPAANWTTSSSVSETATVTDATQSAVVFVGAVSETATASDLTSALVAFLGQIAETATATDITLVVPSVFGTQIQEALTAIDAITTNGTFNVQFVDSATALDSVIGAYLWNLIDDSQGTGWTLINTYTSTLRAVWPACAASPTSVLLLNFTLATPGKYLLIANGQTTVLQLPVTSYYYFAASYVNGYFYVFSIDADNAPLLRSADGIVWETVNKAVNGAPISGIFGNGTQLGLIQSPGTGLGSPSYISTDDGVSWTQGGVFPGANTKYGQTIWDGAKYVRNLGGYLSYSADGLNWTSPTFNSGGDRGYVVWDGTTYVAMQCFSFGLIFPSVVSISSDGMTWTTVPATTASQTASVLLLAAGRFILMNAAGVVLQLDPVSQTFTTLGQVPDSVFERDQYLGLTAATLNGVTYLPVSRSVANDGTYVTTNDFSTFFSNLIANWAGVDDSQNPNWQNISNV